MANFCLEIFAQDTITTSRYTEVNSKDVSIVVDVDSQTFFHSSKWKGIVFYASFGKVLKATFGLFAGS